MNKLYTLTFLLLVVVATNAQEFGGNPPSLKWRQINTDTVRIIFPAGKDSAAQRVAALVHAMAAQPMVPLGSELKKINIVLQNQTTVPNGYVNLGPYRSEFFLTPDPDNLSQGSISWLDQLAIHEYRHVQQFNNFNHGLSSLLKVLSGEDGYSLAINAAIPDWFYEGDAVYNETILSRQGRGRLPHFMNVYPALWQAGKNYSWMKLRNGSLKDFVPNHYFLGYMLVNYGRAAYGLDFWAKVTRDASAFKGLFYPFQKAIKKYAGVDYKTFVRQGFDYYKKSMENTALPDNDYVFPVNHRFVTNYYFPYGAGKDTLIYLKSTYRQRPAFYFRDASGEHLIRYRDISIDDQFSYRNGKIIYAAYETDPRWGWRDYSVIKILDIQSHNEKTLTTKSKYFTPDISPDGSKVAAVRNDETGKSELHILDAATGALITAIRSAEIQVFTDPKFIDNEKLVTAVRLRDGKMALALAEISTGNTSRLTTPSFNVVGYPNVDNGKVYFTASYGGNDDIYMLRLSDNKLFQLTSGQLGNYFVNVSNGKMTWSAFTAEGYLLRQKSIDSTSLTEVPAEKVDKIQERFPVAHSNDIREILSGTRDRNFPVSNYSKSTRLINLHSWRPYYSDPIFTYSIYGENILNTLQTEIYYSYNRNEKTNAVGFSEWYGALFPYLNLGMEYTFDRSTEVGNRLRQWGQLDSRAGLLVPLQSTSGRNFKNFSIGAYYVLRNEFNKGFYKDSLGNTSFSYILQTLSWAQQVQRAVQHFYPRLGYDLNFNHRYAISSVKGYQFFGSSSIYLPGLLRTHNLVLTGAFQQRDTLSQIVFADRFPYSRGYTGRYFSRMWRTSVNYHLPLLYPDWGFGNILYLQSIRLNGFYDLTRIYSRDKKITRDQRSVGGELFVDTRWWNQYPLTFGFRVSKLLDQDQFNGFKGVVYEFVLPVSIIPR